MRLTTALLCLVLLSTLAHAQQKPDCVALSKAMWVAQKTFEQLPQVVQARDAAIATAEAFGNACLTERTWSLTIVPGKHPEAVATK